MLSAFVNCFKIPELRQRILFTLALLFVARVGANIPLPGLDPSAIQAFFADQSGDGMGILDLYNMFTGGALMQAAVFALGIMPYISAAIIMQLMTAVVPTLSRLQREGDVGRQKITQYTRYGTVAICLVQSVLLVLAMQNPERLFPGFQVATYGPIVIDGGIAFLITSVIFLTSGTVLLMWLGEQITQRGIGNGISLLIMISIIADLPGALGATYQLFLGPIGDRLNPGIFILMLALLVLVVAAIVAVTQAQRKIPVHYAKRVVGRKVYGGQSSFMPLKVNYSGVMPVIFAHAILLFPQQVFGQLGAAMEWGFLERFAAGINHGSWAYYLIMGTLILVFSYFWVSIMFKPIQIADDLKKYGGYVPGVRPGEPTAKYLDFIMTRLTLAGAIFLTIVAVFPDFLLHTFNVPFRIAIFFGGTGMLITVGVILLTMQQVESYLLQRHYDGFLKKGRIRGKTPRKLAHQMIDRGEMKNLSILWSVLLILFAIGIIAWVLQRI
ncbi:MAG: preprotein translocase subunit SecY [Opitutales bacterium]|nr:preprotein translocase subunit SecY [Opitutales bacterium]MCH8539877.1 preprotein translocase subunit SecY [Opitutales bacterium]